MSITTKIHGKDNRYAIGACTSASIYDNWKNYMEHCCLDAGSYTLTCENTNGDGWHDGYIEIQGKRYCEDFTSGHQQENNVEISYSGEYIL